jgi:hypothetical protein
MPMLKEFIIGNAQVTDDGLRSPSACQSLEKRSLNGMKKITPAGIERLRKSCPKLMIDSK